MSRICGIVGRLVKGLWSLWERFAVLAKHKLDTKNNNNDHSASRKQNQTRGLGVLVIEPVLCGARVTVDAGDDARVIHARVIPK